MKRYRVAGIVIETEWSLVTELPRAGDHEPTDLVFSVEISGLTTAATERIEFDGVGQLLIVDPAQWIFHLADSSQAHQIEVILLGFGLALWLERNHRVALHGAAATAGTHAACFVGPNSAGKTSLALALVDAGGRFLSDDLLAISVTGDSAFVEPTFPQARLWPDDAKRRLGTTDRLRQAHPDYAKLRVPIRSEFAGRSAPVAAIYLPRRGSALDFQRMTGPPALFSVMLGAFSRRFNDSDFRRTDWFARTAALVETVPVFALNYPDDWDALPWVAEAISTHMRTVDSARRVP